MAKKKSKKSRKIETEKKELKAKEDISSESSDDDSSGEESDVGVALDGVIDENDESSSSEEENEGEKKSKTKKGKKRKKKKKKEEEIQVEFIFCDMDEKFFHGMKILVASSPLHAGHSSALADLMIENVEVGTVVSTEGYDEDHVYGFGSILSLHNKNEIIDSLKENILSSCPKNHKEEMELLLTGEKKTRRLVGLFLHERMLNVPLVITHAIHQQLLLDLEWAVKNNPSFDFGLLVRMAPCYPQKESSTPIYKYFDDDVFASNAEFTYMLPKSYSDNRDDNLSYSVIVLSVSAYKKSIEEVANLNSS